MADRCHRCDRAECQWLHLAGTSSDVSKLDAASTECDANAVDWRARALAAEADVAVRRAADLTDADRERLRDALAVVRMIRPGGAEKTEAVIAVLDRLIGGKP